MTKVFPLNNNDLSSIESVTVSGCTHQKSLENGFGKSNNESTDITRMSAHQSLDHDGISVISDNNIDGNNTPVEDIKDRSVDSLSEAKSDISAEEGNGENQEINEVSLEVEKISHQMIAHKREERHKLIVLNDDVEFSILKCVLHPITIALVGFLSTLPLSLVPAKHSLKTSG